MTINGETSTRATTLQRSKRRTRVVPGKRPPTTIKTRINQVKAAVNDVFNRSDETNGSVGRRCAVPWYVRCYVCVAIRIHNTVLLLLRPRNRLAHASDRCFDAKNNVAARGRVRSRGAGGAVARFPGPSAMRFFPRDARMCDASRSSAQRIRRCVWRTHSNFPAVDRRRSASAIDLCDPVSHVNR